jgi:NAD-dependent SIR2 family protein deacetylase
MTSRAFATAFALRPNLVSWFLGAGASAASGIPTGYSMIRDFKAKIFCSHNDISRREIDAGDQVWIDRMDDFFRRTSVLPPDGDPNEYAAAFEMVYPQERHRRQYIEDAVRKGTPCYGHKVLGALMAARKVDCVFTTNFDPLIEDTALAANALLPVADQARPAVAAIDSGERAMRCLKESGWPLVAKLHGDYQSIKLKNTGSELEKQDENMRHVLVEASQRFGMVFVGYSGRDQSVMEALTSVLKEKTPFPNGLYWVVGSASKLLPAVTEFLTIAHHAGVDVAVIECSTFDELAADLIKEIDLPSPLLNMVTQGRPTPRLVPVELPSNATRQYPMLRLSALLIDSMPQVARRVTLVQPLTTPAARGLLREQNCKAVVAAYGRDLAVFGKDEEIVAALASVGGQLAGTVDLNPTQDSWALGLLYDALTKALSRHRPLIPRYKRSGHSLLVAGPREGEDQEWARKRALDLARLRAAYEANLTGRVPKLDFPFHEGVFLKLEQIEDRWWCGFEPYTFVDVPREQLDQTPPTEATSVQEALGVQYGRRRGDPAGDWRREHWATKYNKNWANIIDAWAAMLTTTKDGTVRAFGIDQQAGVDASFSISTQTGWSRPGHHHPYFERTK